MCEITTAETSPGNWSVVCITSGLPIIASDHYGMWCANKCGWQEIAKYERIGDWATNIMRKMEGEFDK